MPPAPTGCRSISTPLSRRLTIPSITGPAADDTVAVNLSSWPNSDGDPTPSRFVVVAVGAAAFTVWVTVLEVDVLNPDPVAGRNTAVIGCVPTVRLDVVNVATPPGPTLPVPIWAPLSRKLTVPVVGAGPVIAVTVAVNVTDCPTVAVGLLDASDAVVLIADGLFTFCVMVFDAD